MLPDVDSVDRGAAGHQGGVLVGEAFDEKFSVFAAAKPSPAASEYAHRTFGHLLFPLFIASESIVDFFGQFALRFLAGVGKGFPKNGVVGVTTGVVADGGADLGGNGI